MDAATDGVDVPPYAGNWTPPNTSGAQPVNESPDPGGVQPSDGTNGGVTPVDTTPPVNDQPSNEGQNAGDVPLQGGNTDNGAGNGSGAGTGAGDGANSGGQQPTDGIGNGDGNGDPNGNGPGAGAGDSRGVLLNNHFLRHAAGDAAKGLQDASHGGEQTEHREPLGGLGEIRDPGVGPFIKVAAMQLQCPPAQDDLGQEHQCAETEDELVEIGEVVNVEF